MEQDANRSSQMPPMLPSQTPPPLGHYRYDQDPRFALRQPSRPLLHTKVLNEAEEPWTPERTPEMLSQYAAQSVPSDSDVYGVVTLGQTQYASFSTALFGYSIHRIHPTDESVPSAPSESNVAAFREEAVNDHASAVGSYLQDQPPMLLPMWMGYPLDVQIEGRTHRISFQVRQGEGIAERMPELILCIHWILLKQRDLPYESPLTLRLEPNLQTFADLLNDHAFQAFLPETVVSESFLQHLAEIDKQRGKRRRAMVDRKPIFEPDASYCNAAHYLCLELPAILMGYEHHQQCGGEDWIAYRGSVPVLGSNG